MPKFLIMDEKGMEHELALENLDSNEILNSYPKMKILVRNEVIGNPPKGKPRHTEVMRKLEMVDYEEASDVGHLRFYPNGSLVFDLLRDLAFNIADELGSMKIRTPLVYRSELPDIAKQAEHFREKDYRMKIGNKKLILGFASDFGLFRMMKDVLMSHKQLPLRMYDFHASFRLEQRGECTGLKRLRYFYMPDIHCFCKDLEAGKKEYIKLFTNYWKLGKSVGIDFEVAFRIDEEFYKKCKEMIKELLDNIQKPALIELIKQKHYWVIKHEFQYIYSDEHNVQVSTVQLDVEDSETYGIKYTDADGKKKGCIIVHSSMGSIERWIGALLEDAIRMEKEGKAPTLPVWLSPEQVRLIPVADRHLGFAEELAEKLRTAKIRVGIDDRAERVNKKVFDAKQAWVPYIIVVGDKEKESGKLPVVIRNESETQRDKMKEMDMEELRSVIYREVKDKPVRPIYTPEKVSMRPIFVAWSEEKKE